MRLYLRLNGDFTFCALNGTKPSSQSAGKPIQAALFDNHEKVITETDDLANT